MASMDSLSKIPTSPQAGASRKGANGDVDASATPSRSRHGSFDGHDSPSRYRSLKEFTVNLSGRITSVSTKYLTNGAAKAKEDDRAGAAQHRRYVGNRTLSAFSVTESGLCKLLLFIQLHSSFSTAGVCDEERRDTTAEELEEQMMVVLKLAKQVIILEQISKGTLTSTSDVDAPFGLNKLPPSLTYDELMDCLLNILPLPEEERKFAIVRSQRFSSTSPVVQTQNQALFDLLALVDVTGFALQRVCAEFINDLRPDPYHPLRRTHEMFAGKPNIWQMLSRVPSHAAMLPKTVQRMAGQQLVTEKMPDLQVFLIDRSWWEDWCRCMEVAPVYCKTHPSLQHVVVAIQSTARNAKNGKTEFRWQKYKHFSGETVGRGVECDALQNTLLLHANRLGVYSLASEARYVALPYDVGLLLYQTYDLQAHSIHPNLYRRRLICCATTMSPPRGDDVQRTDMRTSVNTFINNFYATNHAFVDVHPIQVPVYLCTSIGIASLKFVDVLSVYENDGQPCHILNEDVPAKLPVDEFLVRFMKKAEVSKDSPVQDFRLWGLFSNNDAAQQAVPNEFCVCHTAVTHWRLLTITCADYDLDLQTLFQKYLAVHTTLKYDGMAAGPPAVNVANERELCQGLMVECRNTARDWPTSRLLPAYHIHHTKPTKAWGDLQLQNSSNNAQFVDKEHLAFYDKFYTIGQEVDVLSDNNKWVAGVVFAIEREQQSAMTAAHHSHGVSPRTLTVRIVAANQSPKGGAAGKTPAGGKKKPQEVAPMEESDDALVSSVMLPYFSPRLLARGTMSWLHLNKAALPVIPPLALLEPLLRKAEQRAKDLNFLDDKDMPSFTFQRFHQFTGARNGFLRKDSKQVLSKSTSKAHSASNLNASTGGGGGSPRSDNQQSANLARSQSGRGGNPEGSNHNHSVHPEQPTSEDGGSAKLVGGAHLSIRTGLDSPDNSLQPAQDNSLINVQSGGATTSAAIFNCCHVVYAMSNSSDSPLYLRLLSYLLFTEDLFSRYASVQLSVIRTEFAWINTQKYAQFYETYRRNKLLGVQGGGGVMRQGTSLQLDTRPSFTDSVTSADHTRVSGKHSKVSKRIGHTLKAVRNGILGCFSIMKIIANNEDIIEDGTMSQDHDYSVHDSQHYASNANVSKHETTSAQDRSFMTKSSLGAVSMPTPSASTAAAVELSSGISIGVKGLNNLGNTCFLNAALQCLTKLPIFVMYFLTYQYKQDINTANKLGTKGKLAEEFYQLLVTIFNQSSASQSVTSKYFRVASYGNNRFDSLSPLSLLRSFQSHKPQFSGAEQQDAQEFLTELLDTFHEDLKKIPLAKKDARRLEQLKDMMTSSVSGKVKGGSSDAVVVAGSAVATDLTAANETDSPPTVFDLSHKADAGTSPAPALEAVAENQSAKSGSLRASHDCDPHQEEVSSANAVQLVPDNCNSSTRFESMSTEDILRIGEERWRQYMDSNESIVSNLFQGQLCTKVTCSACKNVSVTFEAFTTLSLSIPKLKAGIVAAPSEVTLVIWFYRRLPRFHMITRLNELLPEDAALDQVTVLQYTNAVKCPVKVALTLSRHSTIQEVKTKVLEIVNGQKYRSSSDYSPAPRSEMSDSGYVADSSSNSSPAPGTEVQLAEVALPHVTAVDFKGEEVGKIKKIVENRETIHSLLDECQSEYELLLFENNKNLPFIGSLASNRLVINPKELKKQRSSLQCSMRDRSAVLMFQQEEFEYEAQHGLYNNSIHFEGRLLCDMDYTFSRESVQLAVNELAGKQQGSGPQSIYGSTPSKESNRGTPPRPRSSTGSAEKPKRSTKSQKSERSRPANNYDCSLPWPETISDFQVKDRLDALDHKGSWFSGTVVDMVYLSEEDLQQLAELASTGQHEVMKRSAAQQMINKNTQSLQFLKHNREPLLQGHGHGNHKESSTRGAGSSRNGVAITTKGDVKVPCVPGMHVRVHFDNYSSVWDEWYDEQDFLNGFLLPLYTRSNRKLKIYDVQIAQRRLIPLEEGHSAAGQQPHAVRIDVFDKPLIVQVESYRSLSHLYYHIVEQLLRFAKPGDARRILAQFYTMSSTQLSDLSLPFTIRLVSSSNILAPPALLEPLSGVEELYHRFMNYRQWEGTELPNDPLRPVGNIHHSRMMLTVDWFSDDDYRKGVIREDYIGDALPVILDESCQRYEELQRQKAIQEQQQQLKLQELASNANHVESKYLRDTRPGLTIEHVLSKFVACEQMEGYYCEKCKKETPATVHGSIHKLPDVLILHLKRLVMNATGGMKIRTLVKFPLQQLNMLPYTTAFVNDLPPQPAADASGALTTHPMAPSRTASGEFQEYELYGVVNHLGGMYGGHYTAIAKCEQLEASNPPSSDNLAGLGHKYCTASSSTSIQMQDFYVGAPATLPNGVPTPSAARGEKKGNTKWLKFDDDFVIELNTSNSKLLPNGGNDIVDPAIATESAYLLFYQRKALSNKNIMQYL